MNAGEVKRTAKEWVEANAASWPGIRAAHLVGGITTTPDNSPFPAYKDVDLHLIFDEGSPALVPKGLFMNIVEQARELQDRFLALADKIVASNFDIKDPEPQVV